MKMTQQRQPGNLECESVPGAEELQGKRVCGSCVGEQWMSRQIQESGLLVKCDYCGKAGLKTWPLGKIAAATLVVLRQHYQSWTPADEDRHSRRERVTDRWRSRGPTTSDAIVELLELRDWLVAEDIRQILRKKVDAADGDKPDEEALFGEKSCWIYQPTGGGELVSLWHDLESSLKTEARIFNWKLEGFLRKMFNAAARVAQACGAILIKPAGPDTSLDKIYRSRVFQSDGKLLPALESPDISLGAPLSEFAKAGRMNPVGVSVFYGATSSEITLSEVRPPVGSRVVTAAFEIVRPLKVLNADALGELRTTGSHFDPNYSHKDDLACILLLKKLKSRLSQAVPPHDESLQYLATQAIAEYLSHRHDPPLDGILFESSQSEHEGHNLVLFSRACKVESLGFLPGQDDYVIAKASKDGGEDFPCYSVMATKREKSAPAKFPEANASGKSGGETLPKASLRLDVRTLKIHYITGIHVNAEERPVNWKKSGQNS